MTPLIIGDIVMLKSGSPKMTVQHVVTDLNDNILNIFLHKTGYVKGDVRCSWFINNELRQDTFKVESLNKVTK